MDEILRNILAEAGYVIYERKDFLLIRRKIVRSIKIMFAFLIPGILMLVAGAYLARTLELSVFGWLIFIAGAFISNIPFLHYLTAPYKSLLFNKTDRSLLFRARFSRAYKFSEVISIDVRHLSTHQKQENRKDLNAGRWYALDLVFEHNIKEELFRIRCGARFDITNLYEIANYFESSLLRKMS